ncbi:hypothetical protein DPMN_050571 [Dreissena polymorpha]|uniref:Uncharacterized protein n=2 Tax=Dreissena polymorpha TaxID=45954 RepID=A0A9D4CHT1_DREPO|nr:hypothetical protein DPMN_050571 [Dreissena polymorpha]
MIEGIVHFLAATIYIVDPIVYILIRKAKRLKKLFCGLCLREKSHGIGALSLNKRNASEIAKAERPTEFF